MVRAMVAVEKAKKGGDGGGGGEGGGGEGEGGYGEGGAIGGHDGDRYWT